MKNVTVAILLGTLYALFFQIVVLTGFPLTMVIVLFCMAPLLILYMVYVILKYGTASEYTWDERFYEDHDYIRNGKEELTS